MRLLVRSSAMVLMFLFAIPMPAQTPDSPVARESLNTQSRRAATAVRKSARESHLKTAARVPFRSQGPACSRDRHHRSEDRKRWDRL
jgi:hypothetical protein